MSYQLVVDVLDHAPPMTQAERLLLVALAELMRTRREWSVDMRVLRRRTGLSAVGVRKALQRLAERDLDVRVPLGKDRRGEPYYSVPGYAPRYRLPAFDPPPDCECTACLNAQVAEGDTGGSAGDTTGSPSSHRRDKVIREDRQAVREDRQAVREDRLPYPLVSPNPSVPKTEGGKAAPSGLGAGGAPPSEKQAWISEAARFMTARWSMPEGLAQALARFMDEDYGDKLLETVRSVPWITLRDELEAAVGFGELSDEERALCGSWLDQMRQPASARPVDAAGLAAMLTPGGTAA